MAAYYTAEVLRPENDSLARYYAGVEVSAPLSRMDQLGQQLNRGEINYSDTLSDLMAEAIENAPAGEEIDYDRLQDELGTALADAATRADFTEAIAERGGTIAEIRPDISSQLADRLGIDRRRPPTIIEVGRLLNGRRADGAPIPGKKVDRPMRSVVEVFRLDGRRLPTAAEVDRVLSAEPTLAGSRANPRARFLAAFGVPFAREATAEEIAHIREGRMASGLALSTTDVLRRLNATKPPVAYIDLTWSADKSVTVAWALAETEAERSIIQTAHRDAVSDAMRYVEATLGFARTGAGGQAGIESAQLAWIHFHHYTSRPVAPIAATPTTTVFEEFAPPIADPQLHTHSVLLNAAQTESGRITSVNLDQLDGKVKELGHVYQAFLAKNLRRHGVEVALDPATGTARIVSIPPEVRRFFSRRTDQAHEHARGIARDELGKDWDSLPPDQQIALLRRSVLRSRSQKEGTDGRSDFAAWRGLAEGIGYRHGTVLRPDAIRPEREAEARHRVAYDVTLPIIEDAFSRRAKFDGQEIREFAARGLVAAGIDNPAIDIAAVTKAYREQGIRQDGKAVGLIWGKDVPLRGQQRWSVTTALHESEEREVIGLAAKFAKDRSAGLWPRVVERSVKAFLDRNPEIDPAASQWRAQRAVIDLLATGGRLGVAFGVAGSGKSTFLSPLVDAYRADGRTVYGIAVAWRHAGMLSEAGIEASRRASVDAFLRRVEKGQYKPDRKSVVIIEELSLVGRRHMLSLLRQQQRLGFKLIAIGDPRQGQSVEVPVIEILQRAIGREAIPAILTTVRQRTEREREIAGLFRSGRAGEAITAKREDGTALLVAGGTEATIRATADLWRRRMEVRGGEDRFSLTVSAPTNADVMALGLAIRGEARRIGLIDPDDRFVIEAGGRSAPVAMPLAVGDVVRVFERIRSPDRRMADFAANGEVVRVLDAGPDGMLTRNARGVEMQIPWAKLRESPDAPVRLTYGYAVTIDAIQGATSTEHIDALPSGSRLSQGLKGYVAESRHREATWMVVSDAAERQQIGLQIPLGQSEARAAMTEEDVWQNIGRNLSQQPIKATALDFIAQSTELHRGTVATFHASEVPIEQRAKNGVPWDDVVHARETLQASRHPIVERASQVARDVRQIIIDRFHGRDLGRGIEP